MGLWRPFSDLVNSTRSGLPLTILGALLGLPWFGGPSNLLSQAWAESPPASAGSIATYQSDRFLLNTDVVETAAEEQLKELNRLSERLEDYWGKKSHQKIACWWVADLKAWPADQIPSEAREKIKQRSAVTLTERAKLDDQVVSITSKVYSSAKAANLHHEVVHAFCWQTFGRCGPNWFAEGMAEVLAHEQDKAAGVQYFPWAIDYLRKDASSPTPSDIVSETESDRSLWQVYAHRWALCYLLKNHPRYATQFRDFSRQLLRGDEADFQRDFADVRKPLSRDYRQFLRDVGTGYQFPANPTE